MKKSSKLVTLGLLALTAMACDDQAVSSDEVKHCVDNDGVVVDESMCNPADLDAGMVGAGLSDCLEILSVNKR
jgi:hypothetical protein